MGSIVRTHADATRCLPDDEPIDLLNIAFQRNPALPPLPKSKDTAQPSSEGAYAEGEKPPDGLSAADHKRLNDENGEYKVPDRIGGLEALDELRLVCPGREWRFIEVDVTFEEYQAHRERVVDLMYPCTTGESSIVSIQIIMQTSTEIADYLAEMDLVSPTTLPVAILPAC